MKKQKNISIIGAAIGNVFKPRNLLKVLAVVLLGFFIRKIITSCFDLDITQLHGYFLVLCPSILATSILSLYLDELHIIGSNDKFIPEMSKLVKDKWLTFKSDIYNLLNPRTIEEEISIKSDAQELERRKQRKFKAVEQAEINRNNLNQYRNSPATVADDIPDTSGIGTRGFSRTETNQPYAKDLAKKIQAQNHSSWPTLGPVAKNFFGQVLPVIRPEVYGENPTVAGKAYPCTKKTIDALNKLP